MRSLCVPCSLCFYFSNKKLLTDMKRLEDIYNMVVEATMLASGLRFDELAVSRSERCVTARVVLVDVLLRLGMSEGDIVRLSGMSQQRVNALKNSGRFRLKGLCARVMRDEVWEGIKTSGEGLCSSLV